MKIFLKHKNGQHLLEYALVIALVAAAAVAMRVYVQRSAQGSIKMIEEEAFKDPNVSPVGGYGYPCDPEDNKCSGSFPYCILTYINVGGSWYQCGQCESDSQCPVGTTCCTDTTVPPCSPPYWVCSHY